MLDMETKRFPAGAKIFGEGDHGDMAFLVESGRVEISRQADDRKIVLGEIQAGGLFGEMALVDDEPRMATATTTRDTKVFVVPQEVFKKQLSRLAEEDRLISRILGTLVSRLRGQIIG